MSADLSSLALAQALYKACGELVDSRGGARGASNLRTEADGQLRDLYETEGVDRVRLRVNGEPVGTLSARVSKPSSSTRVEVGDADAFAEWLAGDWEDCHEDGTSAIQQALADPKARRALLDAATAYGEVPAGCVVVADERPAMWLGTTLRVDAAKVAAAYGSPAALDAAVAGLLSGGGGADDR